MGNSTSYTLGRAFLQSAFLGYNWRPKTGNGNWFFAQAPGPNTPTSTKAVSIQEADTTIEGTGTSWKESWDGYWHPPPKKRTSAHDSKQDSGQRRDLSAGARDGIGVGASLGGLALIGLVVYFLAFLRKKKSRTDQAKDGESDTPRPLDAATSGPTVNEKRMPEQEPFAPNEHSSSPQEVDRNTRIAEFPGSDMVHEMPVHSSRTGLDSH